MTYEKIQACAKYIRRKHTGPMPHIAMVLGSGQGGMAEAIQDATILSYDSLPGFPKATVVGHEGRMLIGMLENKPVICMQGRSHAYEGRTPEELGFATRVLWALGVETLVLTNAAGSLQRAAGPGSLMMITDHINFAGVNPLVGMNDDRIGSRFPDVSKAWDPELRDIMQSCAKHIGVTLHEGVYIMTLGPSFETPAEIKAFRTMGADAVGMSTVPECLTARHCGIKVVGVSSITNYAAGMTDNEISHTEALEYGAIAAVNLEKLLRAFLVHIV